MRSHPGKNPSKPVKSKPDLTHVLKQSKKIKKDVKQAATELASVNHTLKKGKKVDVSDQKIKKAIDQNEVAEHKVSKAVDDLKQVNSGLAKEVTVRVVIESELTETKTQLAEVRGDLSKSQASEEEARTSALKDAPTGLPNRVSFEQSLEQALIQAKRHGWGLAVLFIDIDNFKNINDSYGHDCGDRVLRMVASRLQSSIRGDDAVCRWGGDEFVCLLLEIKQEADAVDLAEQMVSQVGEACEISGKTFVVKASIGIAIYPANGETAEALLKNADSAMYKAKKTEKKVALFRESAGLP